MVSRSRFAVVVATIGLATGACGGNGTGLSGRGLQFVRGDGAADTILTPLSQALVVEVRDAAGAPVSGTTVRFEALLSGILVAPLTSVDYSTSAADATDGSGRASVLIKLGSRAGSAKVRVTAPLLGLEDTARFTVLPGQPAHVVALPADTVLYLGRTFQARATVTDQFGNPRPEAVSYAPLALGVTVTPSGLVAAEGDFARASYVVDALGFSDTGWVSVVPSGTLAAWEANLNTPGSGIVTFNLDGSDYRYLVPDQAGFLRATPAWTSSGTAVAFGGSAGWLYTTDLSGSVHLLGTPGDSGLTLVMWPTYSPDGQYLYFTGLTTGTYARYGVWRANADGTDPHLLHGDSNHSWRESPSPDGTQLAYVANDGYDPSVIRVYNLSSHTVSSWSVYGETPRWSPNGDLIAFTTQGGGAIKVMNPDGTGVRQVTSTGFYEETVLTWSPDGVWLLVRNYYGVGLELINLATGLKLPLGYSGRFWAPAWKP